MPQVCELQHEKGKRYLLSKHRVDYKQRKSAICFVSEKSCKEYKPYSMILFGLYFLSVFDTHFPRLKQHIKKCEGKLYYSITVLTEKVFGNA